MARFIIITNSKDDDTYIGIIIDTTKMYAIYAVPLDVELSGWLYTTHTLKQVGTYGLASYLMRNIFLLSLEDLQDGKDYHLNPESKDRIEAKIIVAGSVSEIYEASIDTNDPYSLVDLTTANESKNAGDITLGFNKAATELKENGWV